MAAQTPDSDPPQEALGILETTSFVALVEAADAMAKSADVTLATYERVGCSFVTITCRGDVASVRAAVEAGVAAASRLTGVAGSHIIARPHAQLESKLPIRPGRAPRDDAAAGDTFVCYC